MLLSAYLFKTLPQDFIPDEDIGFLIAYTEAEQGTSSDLMHTYQDQVVNILRKEPAVASLISNSATPQYRQGLVFIALKPRDQRKAINDLIPDYMTKVGSIAALTSISKMFL